MQNVNRNLLIIHLVLRDLLHVSSIKAVWSSLGLESYSCKARCHMVITRQLSNPRALAIFFSGSDRRKG